eukprot:4324531-Karenia_brevis.AAC.1
MLITKNQEALACMRGTTIRVPNGKVWHIIARKASEVPQCRHGGPTDMRTQDCGEGFCLLH